MNRYFEEGEEFLWIRDRDYRQEEMSVPLKMIKESHRSGGKQGMIARDVHTGKKYFVKVLFCDSVEQIYVEKESKVQLYSPFVIRIYGGMLDEKNKRFVTLVEYIEQSDLSVLLSEKGIAGETWNEKRRNCHKIALKFLYGINHYMSVYRQDPIVHRDLKPENVLAAPDGSVVKIIDFDWVHLHASNVTVMQRREQKGTPGYADPKYWNSYVCRKEMDIYSAGLVLYFLYTGRHHFHGNEEIQRYMVGDDYAYTRKEMPGTDAALSGIIAGMIAREEERYRDIRDVIRDMEDYLKSTGQMPEIPERLAPAPGEDAIRFSYRIGDVKYSPYVKNYRFLPIEFGTRQERSQNGKLARHILSFYRMGDKMKDVILHEDCHKIREAVKGEVSVGDSYLYAGTVITVTQIKRRGL